MNNKKFLIIPHVNDTVKPKISKFSYTSTTWFTLYIFKTKHILKQFIKPRNFNLQLFHCSSVAPVYTKMCQKSVCC